MTYTTETTGATGLLVGATDWNIMRDDLTFLLNGHIIVCQTWRNAGTNYSTASTTFGNVDAVDGKMRITISSCSTGRCKVTAEIPVSMASGTEEFRFSRDAGAEFSGDATHGQASASSVTISLLSMTWVFTGLTNASHTFDIQFRATTATTVGINNSAAGTTMIAEEV